MFFRRVEGAWKYGRALRLIDKRERFPEALDLIQGLGPGLPVRLQVLICLCRGYLYAAERKLEEAYADLKYAYEAASRINRVFSKQDIRYIKLFASELGILVSQELGKEDFPFQRNYDDFDLRTVHRHLLRNYPLTGHPEWKG